VFGFVNNYSCWCAKEKFVHHAGRGVFWVIFILLWLMKSNNLRLLCKDKRHVTK